ncbi:hypothetical protein B9Z19DRAFT_1068808 [Tuber borchii]|uniref:Apple domain-containing protein n=1 Tax=Tuber borchii TaxID=42251 RepID=A0A2T6ZE18_TUBBO|nr:hypothetical protein B9Z19DRAFT_1068808 [Tuber borchii]
MQYKLISALLVLLAAAVVQGTPVAGSCNADNVLRALRRFSSEAIPFCSSYINVPTITTSTTYTAGTITTTATATLVVNKREAEEDIVFGLPVGDESLARRDGPAPALPSYVSQYPPERVSSACSCMTIPTLTATATIPVTATATQTQTVTGGSCDKTYNTYGNGSNNRVEIVPASSAKDCCQKCQARHDCVASAFVVSFCQHLVNQQATPGELVTPMCPLGVEDYHFGPPAPGLVYAGPCGY